MELISTLKEAINDLYGFKEVIIEVTEDNYKQAKELQKHSMYNNKLGIGTFLSPILLWRVIDQNEFDIIFKGNSENITGGYFSIKSERDFGPSFTGSREDAINAGIRWGKNGRLSGNLYLLGINGEDKEFLNLRMVDFLKERGIEYSVGDFVIDSSLGYTGLGYSVKDVKKEDLLFVYRINKDGEDITLDDITYDLYFK